MRIGSANYRDIVAACIKKFGIENLPKGFDERYAYKDLIRLLEQTSLELAEGREHLRMLELERLDLMAQGMWDRAAAGEKEAVQTVLSIMQRRAKMTGLDAPIEYTIEDIRSIARKVVYVINAEVAEEDVRERIFAALGFTGIQ